MWNPLRYRADRPTKGWHKDTPRTGRKTAPKSPTVVIPSFEIRSSDPDPRGVTPSWRNTDQLSKVDFVTIECEKNTHDPHGDPIAKQRRIDERKKPSFRSSAQKSATRPEMGDPIAKAWRQPLGKVRKESSFRSRSETKSTRQGGPIVKIPTKHQEGGGRAFVPIEDWDRLDPEGWPHREDLNAKTEAEIPKELRHRTLEVGQMGEAREYTPEPTNWRGSTTNGHSQSWDSTDETSRGLSMDARPAGMRQWPDRKAISQRAPQ